MPSLPPAVEAAVAAIWDAEHRLHPALFNGRVFCADHVTPALIRGHWTEYRRVLAQLRRPKLFEQMRIQALAVNGLLECADGLVLGRRQAQAIYLPGCWQAAPAGNVEARDGDGLDLDRQLLAELHEELGIEAVDIEQLTPVAAIAHAGTHVLDVGYLMRTRLGADAIERNRARAGNDEYDRIAVVPPAALDGFLQQAGPSLLPSASILIGHWIGRLQFRDRPSP